VAKNMTDRKKNVSPSQATEVKPQEQAQTTSGKTIEERRAAAIAKSAPKAVVSKQPTTKRSSNKGTSTLARLRNNKIGRFLFEAYYELRHKVTWPTFEEARNMTVMVLIISAVLGGLLSLIDLGLYHLFLLVING
jgi:preprotein translocase SecE subunit